MLSTLSGGLDPTFSIPLYFLCQTAYRTAPATRHNQGAAHEFGRGSSYAYLSESYEVSL